MRQAAAQLQTSTATVYGLCEGGALEHVRISTNAIRIRSADLARFIRDREGHR